MASVSIEELKKAIKSLDLALKEKKNDIVRDATIQRFEFCMELSWKVSKKVLGTSSSSPKSVIREMAQDGMIDNPSLWLRAIDERNLSSHTYDEKLADRVYDFAKSFLPELEKLLNQMK